MHRTKCDQFNSLLLTGKINSELFLTVKLNHAISIFTSSIKVKLKNKMLNENSGAGSIGRESNLWATFTTDQQGQGIGTGSQKGRIV